MPLAGRLCKRVQPIGRAGPTIADLQHEIPVRFRQADLMTLLEGLDLGCQQGRAQQEAVPLRAEGPDALLADLRELLMNAFNTAAVYAPSLLLRPEAVLGRSASTLPGAQVGKPMC
jgi:hypothetical protein